MLSKTWYGAGLAAVLLVLTGACGSPADPPTSIPASTGPSPSPSPSPSASAAPTVAADGTDLAACADGTCEVRLDHPATIEVDASFGVEVLSVVSIDPERVTFHLVDAPGDGFSFACDHHSCAMTITGQSVAGPGGGTGSAGAGARVTVNRLVIEVVAVSAGYTILRLAPAP